MLDREQIIRALRRLSDLLKEREIEGELCLLGGTVMVLGFQARVSTKGVDAIFSPAQVIRELARVIQDEQTLPENWINAGAKAFVSERHETVTGDLPQFDNLRLTMPAPEYLLAMKCIAARLSAGGTDQGDVADIEFLVRRLQLAPADAALSIVRRYYPREQIPARTQFLVEEVFARIGENK